MPRRYYALLVTIILAGAFLRLWQLIRVPPGLHYDLAATALLGNEVAFHGYRPIFISAYTGHEPLFYYWLALWFRLIGSSVFSLRLASALLGVLALPAAFFALRETLRFDPKRSLPLAALGTAMLAAAFFHVTFSRFGFRVISEPVVQALAIGFLMRGLNKLTAGSRQLTTEPQTANVEWPAARPTAPLVTQPRLGVRLARRSFVRHHEPAIVIALGGLFTGLAAYTYLAARLFPVPLAIFWLALLLTAWRADRLPPPTSDPPTAPPASRLPPLTRAFLVYAASALLAFLPLGLYFLRHPEDFANRAGQVVPRVGEGALLLAGVRRALEMVFLNGEPYDRFNLPGLPLFGPVLGVFFVIGLLVTLRTALQPPRRRAPLARAVEWLLLAWLPAMLAPTALSVHDVFPSNVRAFGLIPLLFVFPARGLLAAFRWVQRRLPGPLIAYPYPMLVVTLLVLAGGVYTTRRQYFVEWANLPAQRQNNDADLTGIAAYLNEQDLAGTNVYVSSLHYRHPTLAYLARDFGKINWLTGGASLAVPAQGAALYAFARSALPPAEWIAGWEPYLVEAPLDPDGVPSYRIYRFPPGQASPLPELAPLDENFGNVVTLTGYRVTAETAQLLVDVRWRVENLPQAGDVLPYARLTDSALASSAWAQSGGFSYPSEQWRAGDTVLARLALPLPAGLPPGDYVVKIGFYSAGADLSLPRLAPDGAYAGERAPLPPVRLAGALDAGLDALLAEHALTPPASQAGLDAAPNLLGYSLNTSAPRQGERLRLTLFWQAAARSPVAEPLTVSLGARALYTGHPVHGTLPLGQLQPGQVLVDGYALRVPPDFAPGASPLAVTVPGAGSATLAALDVQAVARAFDPPAVETPSGALFHDPANGEPLLALLGYTLAPGGAGAATSLRLAWQAQAPMAQDYTAFVHVRGAAGQIVAQQDGAPAPGYPTSLWQPGEYVTSDYAFNLPPSTYQVAVGLYLPETGQRLELAHGLGDALWLPEIAVR
ncbi:MAG: hypothetical protein IT318_22210 [Anaerolineales bacterium]|nr:hypothetical protein [Anaerolineales bacterium]